MAAHRRTWRAPRTPLSLAACAAGCLIALACSEPTRHRVLSFFFDGVPQPGEEKKPRGYAPSGAAVDSPMARAIAERAAAERLMVTHAPYRNNQCDTCHNVGTGGGLFKSPQEGLCASCHSDVPGGEPFVHGPVAINDCLVCHHPHGSAHPHILLEEPTRLCLGCHRQEDLSPSEYHAPSYAHGCTDCHDGHGGSDPYFLKAGWPTAPAATTQSADDAADRPAEPPEQEEQ